MRRSPPAERAPRRGGRRSAAPAALLALLALALVAGLGALLRGGEPEAPLEGLTSVALGDGAEAPRAEAPVGASTRGEAAAPLAPAPNLRRELAEPDPVAALAQDAGRPLGGVVLASETREPVEGAALRLFTDAWESTATSDADGRFELRLVAGDAPALEVACAGFAPARRPQVPADAELVVELLPEARIEGVVVDAPPEALREGRALLWDLTLDRRLADAGAELALDASGAFAFGGLRAGEYTVGSTVPGFALAYEARVTLEPGEVKAVVLRARPAASLRGVVHARDSEDPIADARVRAVPRLKGVGEGFEAYGEVEVQTDAEGAYLLEGLSLGQHRVEVEAPWGSRTALNVVVQEEAEELERDLRLDLPASVSGSVLNGAGLGVAGAVVEVSWDEEITEALMEGEVGVAAGQRRVVCDLNGRFRFEDLPAGRTMRVIAHRARTSDASDVELLGRNHSLRLRSDEEREGVTLHVDEPQTLRGEVSDEFGRPLAGVELTVRRRVTNRSSRRNREKRTTLLGHSRAASGEDGAFELVGLLPGNYELRAEGERLFPRKVSFGVPKPPARPRELALELRRGETLSGWVVDELGDAVANASLVAELLRPVDVDVKVGTYEKARADAFGRFAFDVLDAGLWEVRAGASGYESPPSGVLARTDAGAPVEIELERTEPVGAGTITGVVRAADDGALKRLRFEPLRGGVLALEDEGFEIAGMRAGQVNLRVSAEGYLPYRSGALQLLADGELDLGVVALQPAGSVRVFASDAKGRPLKSFSARLVRQAGPSGARSMKLSLRDAKHRYAGGKGRVSTKAATSSLVPYGVWQVSVGAPGHRSATRQVVIGADGRSQTVEVRLQAKGPGGKGKSK